MKRKITHKKEVEFIGFGYRFVAAYIDNILFGLLIPPFFTVAYFIGLIDFNTSINFIIGYVLIYNLMQLFITIGFWSHIQATPGKRFLNSQIVDFKTGQPASIWRLFLRFISYLISIIPLFFGFIWIGFDKNKRGFHDYIARTAVIADENIRPLDEKERKYYKPCIRTTPTQWMMS